MTTMFPSSHFTLLIHRDFNLLCTAYLFVFSDAFFHIEMIIYF